jgi:hypothetical protein
MFCLYILFIWWFGVVKVFKGFRFEPELYGSFKQVASAGGFTVTGAFERFMTICVDRGGLVFPERRVEGLDVEARVLINWLGKGKNFFYGAQGGEQMSVATRLIELLPKLRDAALMGEVEEALKKSVNEQK